MTDAAKPIRNDNLLECIRKVKTEATQENIVAMFNAVVQAKLLAPIELDQDPTLDQKEEEVYLEKDTTISFELIQAANGDLYYPVFTHGEALKQCSEEKDQHSLIVNFDDLANMILQQKQAVKGFVINPMGENICFTSDMIEGMIQSMKNERSEQDQ